jgi:hypothetical protein
MVNYDVGEKASAIKTSFWDQVSYITGTGINLSQ